MNVWERGGRAASRFRSPMNATMRRSVEAWIRFKAGLDQCTVDLDIHPYTHFDSIPSVVFSPGTHTVVRIGPHTQFGRGVTLNLRGGTLLIGESVEVRQRCILNVTGRLELGDRVKISVGVYLHCAESVQFGADSMVGEYSTIVDNKHLRTPPGQPIHHTSRSAPIVIGRNTWICPRSCVTEGVTVGDQCIVASNSVVTKDLPPWSLAGGVPARVLKTLEVDPELVAAGR